MDVSNAALDLASERADQERENGIRAASAAIAGSGFTHCVDCGGAIDEARRAALPSAKRCFGCQSIYEMEQAAR